MNILPSKVSEVIARLQELQAKYGDLPVYHDGTTGRSLEAAIVHDEGGNWMIEAYDDIGRVQEDGAVPTHIFIH